jgi:LysM repeat protein
MHRVRQTARPSARAAAPRRRLIGRFLLALGGCTVALVAVPLGLMALSRWRFGSASPLAGGVVPWRWTGSGVSSWFDSLARSLQTSDGLINVFLRVAVVVAWACVAVLGISLLAELRFQRVNGMPSTPRVDPFGLGGLTRVLATGLLAILPTLQSTASLVHADASAVVHARAASTVVVGAVESVPADAAPAAPSRTLRVSAPRAGQLPATVTVQPGDSVWSIAAGLVPAGNSDAVATLADKIVAANLGQLMTDGDRFTTPALIQPGWVLQIPGGVPSVPTMATVPTMAAATADDVPSNVGEQHVVQAGDSYWSIAEHIVAHQRDDGGAAVVAATNELMDANAPRLGYSDPAMLHPGDVVYVSVATTQAESAPSIDDSFEPSVKAEANTPSPTAPTTTATTPASMPVETATPSPAPTATSTTSASTATPAEPSAAAPLPAPSPSASTTTPSSSTSTSTSTPDVAAAAESTTDDSRRVRNGLAGAALLAAGVLGLIAARRRSQMRRSRVTSRLAPPTPLEARTEAALRAAVAPSGSSVDIDPVMRLDVALRAAGHLVRAAGDRIVAALVGDDGDVLLLGTQPMTAERPGVNPATTAPFVIDDASGGWWLSRTVDWDVLAEASVGRVQPCPAMVHLGRADGADLWVDVESCGSLSIDLPPTAQAELLRQIAASWAVSPFATGATSVVVGIDDIPVEFSSAVTTAADIDDALANLDERRPALSNAAGATFNSRTATGNVDDWAPMLLVSAEPLPAGREVRPDSGVAVVAAARADNDDDHGWVVRADGQRAVLQPLGVGFDPVGVTHDDLVGIADLVAAASADLLCDVDDDGFLDAQWGERAGVIAHPSAGDVPEPPAVAPFVEPAHQLLVRTFGCVEVLDAEGRAATFERSKALELVVWLAHHRVRPTRSGARTALWTTNVRDATFANVVSDARRAMARLVTPPDGDEWIARTLTDDLPLHAGVVTDADLLRARLDAATSYGDLAAVDVLRPGLELVCGLPFAGTSYLWPDGEGTSSSLVLLAIAASTELASRYLALGDVDGVFWATGQGLAVLPAHEELLAMRMRAHAASGDLAGVRSEWESYERVLDADPMSSGDPSPKLVALRKQLLTATAG